MFCSLDIVPDTKYRYSEWHTLHPSILYLKHGIIFLGNSTNICHVFTLQKRIITITLVYGLTAHAEIYSIN